MSYKRQELLALRWCLGSHPVFGGVRVAHLFSFLCCVLFVCVLCLACPMLPVSFECPFLIAPSVFSNVYIQLINVRNIHLKCRAAIKTLLLNFTLCLSVMLTVNLLVWGVPSEGYSRIAAGVLNMIHFVPRL